MAKTYIKSTWVRYLLLISFGVFVGLLFARGPANQQDQHALQHQHEEGTTWTCSMHPQIRQSEPGKCPLCGMDLIPASRTSSSGEKNPFQYEMTPEAVALSNIRTTLVQPASGGSTQNELSLTGKIKVNEQKIATIAASFPGRIETLHVNFTGEEVNKGQKLASIYSPEIITAQKELLEAAKTKTINSALYNAAREKLRSWRVNDQQIEAIETRGEIKSVFDIYANTAGIVTMRNVAEGDYVGRGATLFEIANLSTLWVLMDAYESDLAWINQGSKIVFTAPAVPGKEFSSVVSYIDPVINPATRTVSIRAEIDNPEGKLKPEMFVRANVMTSTESLAEGVTVPRSSVLWTGKRSVVYVKVPETQNPTFEMREVSLGSRLGELYLIEEGLNAGEEVVTHGAFTVDAAAQLSGNYSMMERPVAAVTLEVADHFQVQLTEAVDSYFNIKNALVASDASKAASLAKDLQMQLQQIDGSLLKDQAGNEWSRLAEP
ncbi:MAG: efflux RND transporter periplasmic adaptor subunit, partial [Bacteroidota bacterium]|nr:efflux RND transporter periplasmic adaptor subunit [Bacteroidota bacterium]